MPNVASAWQLRLQKHFETLAVKKRNAGQPLFAIEHALSPAEIKELQSVARAELVLGGLRSEHWLIWVVYATEYGYGFDGLQFWEDFSDQTPKWYLYGDRYKIRLWFRRFQSDFGGIEPRGRWASHFSIISWPITHSILPKDLQRQLARTIYEAQYELRHVADRSAFEVGWTLANTVYEGSQRFFLFLEQEELVGQIVISLLGNIDESNLGIEPIALARIRQDLSAMHDARDWIKEAQQTWRSSAPQFRVAGSVGRSEDSANLFDIDKPRISQPISLIPTVEAQQLSGNNWRFELTVPSFSEVAALKPEFKDFLRKTRVSIPMAETSMLPGGWLLIGVRKRVLKSWPTHGEGLLQFEDSPPFDGLVNWELTLPKSNKVWVFKIQNDGAGRLMRGNQLRPDCSYLIVAPNDINLVTLAPLCQCEFKGVSVCRIDLPKLIPPELHTLLNNLGLQCAQSITLSAAGIPPLQWDEELGGEWLANTRPMLLVKRDHEFEGYQFGLDGGEMVEALANPTQPTLIELPFLSSGKHKLSIRTYTTNRDHTITRKHVNAELQFQISIKDPKPWVSGETNYPGMFVSYAPLNPSIEDFLAGEVSLDVLGESDVCVITAIVLKDSTRQEILRRPILEHKLPISNETWERSYRSFLEKNAKDSEYYACNTAYLEVSSIEFGSYKISLERHFSPLRWHLTHKDSVPSMRVIEQGSSEGIEVSFSDFSTPLIDVKFTQSEIQNCFVVTKSLGLFRARAGEIFTDVIYAPIEIKGGLTALHVPFSDKALANVSDFSTVLERAAIWHKAKSLTYLAKIWQKQLVKSLFDKVVDQYCGHRWHKAEHELHDCPYADTCWENLESIVLDNQSYGLAVGKAKFAQIPSSSDIKVRLKEITQKHKIDIDDSTFDLAWKLAWFDDFHEPLNTAELQVVAHYGKVIRAARLMRLRFFYRHFDSMTGVK